MTSAWTRGGATFSADREYRHHLWRERDPDLLCPPRYAHSGLRRLGVVMLNPSSAGEDPIKENDPTVRKLMGFCERWGFWRFDVANLSDYCASKPAELYRRGFPISPGRDPHLAAVITLSDVVLVAWGNIRPRHRDKPSQVLDMCDVFRVPTICIGVTKQRDPLHPLMAKYTDTWQTYPHR